MAYQKKGGNGGIRPGAGRKSIPKSERQTQKAKLRELVFQQDMKTIAADFEALIAVNREILKRLDENPHTYTTEQLVSLSKKFSRRTGTLLARYTGDRSESWLKLRFQVLERDSFSCKYCGRSVLKDGVTLHVDHVIPRSKGGTNDLANLVTACSECNLGKKDVLLEARALEKMLLLQEAE